LDISRVIASLRLAVSASPEDVVLRLHLAELLLESGDVDGAITEAGNALVQEPTSQTAATLMSRALRSEPRAPAEPAVDDDDAGDPRGTFDWQAADAELADIVAPQFVEEAADAGEPAFSAERPSVRLADVGGMQHVKQRLDVAFLAPMRNPELSRLYRKSLRGGLLLYGPPGCGKTFIARAVAGELAANFLSVGISDVLDMWVGSSERNLHELFVQARSIAPCVLFFDEIDGLGQRRTRTFNTATRTTVNQLLTELDDVHASNDGVFVLAATNQPWDVDPALRRPGRFDRTVLVLPPDAAAREAILRYHLRERPVEGIELGKLAAGTDGYSGADLAHVCETAAERAMQDSVRSGVVRMIGMADLEAAMAEVRPSTGPWFEAARNVAMFANEGGAYDELVAYLKSKRML